MKPTIRVFIVCAVALIVTTSAFAALSPQYRDWAKGPEQYLMTPEEQSQWKKIDTDEAAKAFIDLFWARRDPTPATPANEFRTEFERRVQYSDQQFNQNRKRGALTDRGRIFILLGAPQRIERSTAGPTSTIQTPTPGSPTTSEAQPKQIWIYEQGKAPIELRSPIAYVNFIDQYGTNDWTLERGGRTDVGDLMKRATAASVVSPNLTQVPTYSQPAPAAQALPQTTTPAATASAVGALKTESLKTAVQEFRTAKTNPFKPVSVFFTEMVSPAGDYFVPVQLYIPKSADLTAEAMTTFFGVVEDAQGSQVAVFEEPAKISASAGDLYFDKSLTLKPGKYTATLGLAGTDGKPVVMASTPMELKEMSKDTSGISRLIVATDVHQTEAAAPAGAPYAFGRVKIVPKGDRTITNKDEMTYFVELINPGIDEATNMPKVQVKLDLVGTGEKGKPGRTISAPLSDATPLPLSGSMGPGQYAIMASIPLGDMKNPLPPGDYTLRVKVFDQVKKESYTVEQPLKITAAPAAAAAAAPPASK